MDKLTSSRDTPSMRVLSPPTPFFSVREVTHSGVVGVFFLILALLLFASVVSALLGDEPKTFASFLQMLQTAPSVGFEWLNFQEIVLDLPDWLSWLQVVINFLQNVVRVIGFFLTGIVEVISFALHFLEWVFI